MLAQVANMAYHYQDPRLSKKGFDTLEKVYSYLSTAGDDTRLLWQADPLPLPPQSSETVENPPSTATGRTDLSAVRTAEDGVAHDDLEQPDRLKSRKGKELSWC